jgi:hypothetical protein
MARRGGRKANKARKTKGLVAQQQSKKVKAANDADRAAALSPTPEMLKRVEYQFGPVKTEMNIQIGSAYHRRPHYLTLAKRLDVDFDQLAAMQAYRSIFDRCERSPYSSCLAAAQGSGGGRALGPASFLHATPAVVEAKRKLALIERGLGAVLGTMREVVLQDRSFSEIAMERYGCRRRSWIIVDEPLIRDGRQVMLNGVPQTHTVTREEIVPRSGRDRERIAAEFRQGLKLLTTAAQRLSGVDMDEMWVHPRDDGTAVIHRATTAPNGLFRVWGRSSVVDQVVDDLIERFGDELAFASPEEARNALIEVHDGRLHQLEAEELEP